MTEKNQADLKYERQREEFERLQAQIAGKSASAQTERVQLAAKQESLEKERSELVNSYEHQLTALKSQNLAFQRSLEQVQSNNDKGAALRETETLKEQIASQNQAHEEEKSEMQQRIAMLE